MHHIWGKLHYDELFFIIQTSDRMEFFTIMQDKLHSFNIQDDRSTRFLAQQIIERFHEENSIMSGLFSQNNLFLCGMQGNNGLLGKTLKTFPKSPTSQPVLTFDKCQICSASRRVWINIYRVTLQHIKFITFLFYLMVLLCVILKSAWYARHFAYSWKRCSCTTENNRHSDENWERNY